jgi:hypothetical protein
MPLALQSRMTLRNPIPEWLDPFELQLAEADVEDVSKRLCWGKRFSPGQ